MAPVLIAFALIAAGVLVLFGALVGRHGPLLTGPRRGFPVIVCTRRPDDQSILGVLVRQNRAGLTLEGAFYCEPDGSYTPIGPVWLPAAAVSFVQTQVVMPDPVAKAPPARQPVPLPSIERPSRLRQAPPPPPPPRRDGAATTTPVTPSPAQSQG